MNEQRFACVACGKCCYGILPLTLLEAIGGAGHFPLAIALTPVKASERHFKLTRRLGVVLDLSKNQKLAILIQPVAYIPSMMSCPYLAADNLCSIHETKPLRCRTMPFFPCHEEDQQAPMLVPRTGWLCNTSPEAPVVYRDKKIVDHTNFDLERKALEQEAPALQAFANTLLKASPVVAGHLIKAAQGRIAGRVFLKFSSFLRLDKRMSLADFAFKQHGVLEDWAQKTSADPRIADYIAYYRDAAMELACYLEPKEPR